MAADNVPNNSKKSIIKLVVILIIVFSIGYAIGLYGIDFIKNLSK